MPGTPGPDVHYRATPDSTASGVDVVAWGAHPDDTELSCGGTIASLCAGGRSVAVVDLTRGEMGTRGTPQTRRREASNAARILGVAERVNLGMPDTGLANTREHQLAVIRELRRLRPAVCLINAPDDRHPDHGMAAQLLIDAFFYSGLARIETRDALGREQAPWRPSHVLHYMQDRTFEPDLILDISGTWQTKEKAILAFASQLNVKDPGDEPETYISSTSFFEGLRARARHYGHMGGCEYGEPFLYASGTPMFRSLEPFLGNEVKR